MRPRKIGRLGPLASQENYYLSGIRVLVETLNKTKPLIHKGISFEDLAASQIALPESTSSH